MTMTRSLDADSRMRFAPSPTGKLHVGGARTALFSWLAARGCGGKFVLRIEDTDRERSTQESLDAILDGMKWLGLDWDEGPILQSGNLQRHLQVVDQLIHEGHAYPCFCKPEDIEKRREAARAEGRDYVYDGRCRNMAPEVALSKIDNGVPYCVRFHIEPGTVVEFDDCIGGPRRFEADRIGDFILRRSDGSPVFHLGVVVDDHDEGITHILRGDDHVNNTPRQILIYRAMGWAPPVYGHMPMIMGPDRARLSKRHGATSVMAFEREGFLPEAMINFLALLGWSFDDKTELMSTPELIERFSIDRINHSSSVFDRDKLLWMNAHYMKTLELGEIAGRAREFFKRDGVAGEHLADPKFSHLVGLVIERARTFAEMRDQLGYFFVDQIESYDEKGARKQFFKGNALEKLAKMEAMFTTTPDFTLEGLDKAFHEFIEAEGEKMGKFAQPLRLALTGRTASPGIYEVLEALGREAVIKRIHDARVWIEKNAPAPEEKA